MIQQIMYIFQFILLFLLLAAIYIISVKLTQKIYILFYSLISDKKLSVIMLSLVLFPGTIIHELSHFLLASILRVQTGELSIFPKIDKNSQVRAGHLEISKTDPFRLTLIGLAPIIVGIILVYIIGKFFFSNPSQILTNITNIDLLSLLSLFVICYLLFVISCTMFSSKKDLESLLYVGPVILLVIGALYLTGVRVVFEEPLVGKITKIITDLNYYLLIAAGIDYSVLITALLILRISFKVNRLKGMDS